MNPKKLLNDIIKNFDNFEDMLKIHEASNEAKILAVDLIKNLNILEENILTLRRFLESNRKVIEELPEFDTHQLVQLLNECNTLYMKINEYNKIITEFYKNLLDLNAINYKNSNKIYKIVDKIEYDIYNFLRVIREIFDNINDYINFHSIDERYKDNIKKLKKFKKILDEYLEEFEYHQKAIQKIRKAYENMRSYLAHYTNNLYIENDYLIPIIANLKAKLYDRLFSIDILNYITGLYSISANPVSEIISFRIDDDNEPKFISLDELFYRYPPFEPLAIKDNKNNVEILGNKIWFINPENGVFGSNAFKNQELVKTDIIKGNIKKEHITNKLESVELIDLLGDECNSYILLKLDGGVYIKYGSQELKKYISQEKSIEEIEKFYKKYLLEHGRKKAYSPTNLSYIWYCRWGKGLSTDPWDVDCPFKSYCRYGKYIRSRDNRKCPLWSWSRRIFPKVFPVSKRKTPNKKLKVSESFNGIFPIYGRKVLIKEEYDRVQFKIPGEECPINITFKTPIGKELTKTNVVGLAIDKNFIKTIISALLNEKISNYSINLFGINVSISDIILSKCFLISQTNRGLNTYSLLEKDFKRIVDKYKKFKNRFKKGYKVNDTTAEKVINDSIYLLLHTLAHLLLGFLSKELEIKSEDLLYLIDETDEYYRILIVENSPIGALDIIGATVNKFDSLTNMVVKFFESVYDLLKKHEDQLEYYKVSVERHLENIKNSSKKKPEYIHNIEIIKELKNHYAEFLKNGLILDLHYFNTYMQLKKEDRTGYGKYGDLIDSIVEDKSLREKLYKEINNIFTLAFPTYCIDGCTSCILFDKGCYEGLGQTITTSKELTKLFIEIILKGREFRGQGNVLLKNIIESLCKKELIALSPYIDEEGINFLNELSKKGISIKLITNKKMTEDFSELFSKCEFEVYIMKSNHDKLYYIDNKILLKSTANLTLKSNSVNRFEIYPINDSNSYNMILKQAEKWKK
ncbi:phospholipase D-like domain-containing protein [Methanocaldococcus sp.]